VKHRRVVIADALIVLAFIVVCVVLGIALDFFDRIYRLSRMWEGGWLDDLILMLPLSLGVGLLWFSYRRLSDYRRELRERKRVEEALRESEDLYRTLVNTSPDGIIMTDLGGNILMANPAVIAFHGYDGLKDMLSRVQNVTGLYAFDDFPRLLEHTVAAFQKGDVQKYEYTMKRKDGSVFPGELSLAVFWDRDGRPQGFIGVGRDITDRRRAEAELVRYREHLEDMVQERTVRLRSTNERLENEITERRRAETERERLIVELQEALVKVKTLSGLIPICSSCKKIRDDQGAWHKLETYLREHSDAEFSHGLCQDCLARLYPEDYRFLPKENPDLFTKE
jgi:PAS domain S-box-containing protein